MCNLLLIARNLVLFKSIVDLICHEAYSVKSPVDV